MLERLTELENLFLTGKLELSLDNALLKLEQYDDFIIGQLLYMLKSNDFEFRKLALFIILKSNIFNNRLYFSIFSNLVSLKDFSLKKIYLEYFSKIEEETFIKFAYSLILALKDDFEMLEYFSEILELKSSNERASIFLFLLESFNLEASIIKKIYSYLSNKSSFRSITDIYENSSYFSDFINLLKKDKRLEISYDSLEDENSYLRKRLSIKDNISYFYNKDSSNYQLWISVSKEKEQYLNSLTGINFNALIHFPKNLMLYFEFISNEKKIPLRMDLYLSNEYDSSFLHYLLKEKEIDLIFVDEAFKLLFKTKFMLREESLFKIMNQSYLSYNFRDFEYLHIEEYMERIEDGDLLLIDIPISIFRKVHRDISLFKKIMKKIDESENPSNYFKKFNPILYQKDELEVFPQEDLEKIIKEYVIYLDKVYPHFILFINNSENKLINYFSYLLNDDFSKQNIRKEVIKRLIFISKYLRARNEEYVDILTSIAGYFKISLNDEFFEVLSK